MLADSDIRGTSLSLKEEKLQHLSKVLLCQEHSSGTSCGRGDAPTTDSGHPTPP